MLTATYSFYLHNRSVVAYYTYLVSSGVGPSPATLLNPYLCYTAAHVNTKANDSRWHVNNTDASENVAFFGNSQKKNTHTRTLVKQHKLILIICFMIYIIYVMFFRFYVDYNVTIGLVDRVGAPPPATAATLLTAILGIRVFEWYCGDLRRTAD